jgi:hypothetical protein
VVGNIRKIIGVFRGGEAGRGLAPLGDNRLVLNAILDGCLQRYERSFISARNVIETESLEQTDLVGRTKERIHMLRPLK